MNTKQLERMQYGKGFIAALESKWWKYTKGIKIIWY